MPTVTPDQGLSLPIQADAANQQTAFASYNNTSSGVESRLVKRYTNFADRAARNPTPTTGEISFLATPGFHFRWTGSAWFELYPITAYKAAETQVVNNSTVFVNDSHLFIAMQANAVYAIDGYFAWDTGNTGKIKFVCTVPAGAGSNQWTILAPDTSSTTTTGVPNWQSLAGVGNTVARGGAGIGTFIGGHVRGDVTTGGTAGNLTLQWAQNAAEAVNTRVKTGSYLRLQRVG
jgi:hypothetical protein